MEKHGSFVTLKSPKDGTVPSESRMHGSPTVSSTGRIIAHTIGLFTLLLVGFWCLKKNTEARKGISFIECRTRCLELDIYGLYAQRGES
jgi:hypothetical protein